jgi:hypothetical protein
VLPESALPQTALPSPLGEIHGEKPRGTGNTGSTIVRHLCGLVDEESGLSHDKQQINNRSILVCYIILMISKEFHV